MAAKPGVRPKKGTEHRWDFLKSEEVVNSLLDYQDAKHCQVTISLPAIHCIACVWLLENLGKLHPGIISSIVNFTRKQATISYDPSQIELSELARNLERIGYTPSFEPAAKNRKQASNKLLTRMAVAGFCFGNIMLLTFPEYLVSDISQLGGFRSFFSWLILGLSLPVLLFSAMPFLRSALSAIHTRRANFDIPIALGVLVLFAKSVTDIFLGNGPGYMDSFAAFVFLLCIGRWFQNITYEFLSFDSEQEGYLPMAVQRMAENGAMEMTPISRLKHEDVIMIRDQEISPADGHLLSKAASFDFSFITGEAEAMNKNEGDVIYAGGKCLGTPALVKLSRSVRQSYLSGLWQSRASDVNQGYSTSDRINAWSPYFLLALAIISAGVAIVWSFIDIHRVVEVVTAVLIVACPCALALSASFIYGHMQRQLSTKSMFLRQAREIEKLSTIDTVVFDKTGTLSSGFEVSWDGQNLDRELQASLRSITANSNQPLSRAIHEWLGPGVSPRLESFESLPGRGLDAQVEGQHIRIGSSLFISGKESQETSVLIEVDEQLIGRFQFLTKYRDGLDGMFESLVDYDLHLLSGDNDGEMDNVSRWIPKDNIGFNQDPVSKKKYIEALQADGRQVLFIGDGLNDGGAIAQADVGVAVVEDLYQFTPAADGILLANRLNEIPQTLGWSRYSVKALYGALIFSLIYNLIGLAFAASGYLTPLVAAIIMPLSSISVVTFAWLATRQFLLRKFR